MKLLVTIAPKRALVLGLSQSGACQIDIDPSAMSADDRSLLSEYLEHDGVLARESYGHKIVPEPSAYTEAAVLDACRDAREREAAARAEYIALREAEILAYIEGRSSYCSIEDPRVFARSAKLLDVKRVAQRLAVEAALSHGEVLHERSLVRVGGELTTLVGGVWTIEYQTWSDANRELLREAREAEKAARQALIAEVVLRAPLTETNRGRFLAGRMHDDEVQAICEGVLLPDAQPFAQIEDDDLPHEDDCASEDIDYDASDEDPEKPFPLPEGEFAGLAALTAAANIHIALIRETWPQATHSVTVRRHVGICEECEARVEIFGARIRVDLGGLSASSEYELLA